MISSAECQMKIEELTDTKKQIMTLYDGLDECSSSLRKTTSYSDELIINGESVDCGKLDVISNTLSSLESNIDAMVAECDALIMKYEGLLVKALAYEKMIMEQEQRHLR